MKEDQEALWLVKSATRILGPFSKKQIVDLLRNKQINIIDEIKSPTTRWTFIRENIYFLEVVKAIRNDQDTHQDNTINSRTVTVMTKTGDFSEDTNPDSDFAVNEDTGKINREQFEDEKLDVVPSGSNIHDLSFKNIEVSSVDQKIQDLEPISEIKDLKSKPIRSHKTYGASSDKKFRQQTQKSFSQVYIVIGLVILFTIGGFIGYKKYLDYQKALLISSNVQKIRALRTANLYEKSFEAYKALPADFSDASLDSLMVPLALQREKQSTVIRQKLEEIGKSPTITRSEKIENSLVLVLCYILEKNYAKAKEQLEQIKGEDADNNYVKALKAVVLFRDGEISKARSEALALGVFPSWAYNLYLKLLLLVETPKEAITSDLNTKIDVLMHEVEEYLHQGHGFLNFELNLLGYLLSRKVQNVRLMSLFFNNMFDSPLRESEKYIKDPLLDWSLHSWETLSAYCNQAFGEEGDDYRVRLGSAICAFQQGRDQNAADILNQVQVAHGLKPEILNMRGMMLLNQKNYLEVQKLATMKEWRGTDTEKYASVTACLQQRGAQCSIADLDSLVAKPNFRIPAMQLKLQHARMSNSKDIHDVVRKILELEPGYTPALEIRELLEAQK